MTKNLSDYFAVHPDANQALIDATRQSAFSAIGAFNTYFNDHPDQANDIRAIKAPLNASRSAAACRLSPPRRSSSSASSSHHCGLVPPSCAVSASAVATKPFACLTISESVSARPI